MFSVVFNNYFYFLIFIFSSLVNLGICGHHKLLQYGPTQADITRIERALGRIENRFGIYKDTSESDWDATLNKKCTEIQTILNPNYEPDTTAWAPSTSEYGPGGKCVIDLYQQNADGPNFFSNFESWIPRPPVSSSIPAVMS